ncbi:MAG: phosphoribosyltransferase [Nitrosospira sp.]|nr:phosphoribosyltransferase [Nitrosospira sp.]
MFFEDRMAAAKQLAAALSEYRGKQPLVLAIPRGAVPMAKVIADELDGDLEDESGWIYLADYASSVGATQQYIDAEVSAQLEVMRQRRAQYTPVRPPIDPASRVAIVVDDGLATGSTMISALHAIRAKNPRELVCAVPVASSDALKKVEANADRVVCLSVPAHFQAVGQFYGEFPQVDDEEVIAILAGSTHPQAG